MAWRRPGDKPLSEPMMIRSPIHVCVTRPKWVKQISKISWTWKKQSLRNQFSYKHAIMFQNISLLNFSRIPLRFWHVMHIYRVVNQNKISRLKSKYDNCVSLYVMISGESPGLVHSSWTRKMNFVHISHPAISPWIMLYLRNKSRKRDKLKDLSHWTHITGYICVICDSDDTDYDLTFVGLFLTLINYPPSKSWCSKTGQNPPDVAISGRFRLVRKKHHDMFPQCFGC